MSFSCTIFVADKIIAHSYLFLLSTYSSSLTFQCHIHDSILCLTDFIRLQITFFVFNTLNAELNHICYLQALLGAHHFLHVSRIRVKSLTLRLLMSYIYIYIYIYMEHLFVMFLDHTQRRTTVGRTPLDE